MNAANDKNVEKWIDLSILPNKKFGDTSHIDWCKTIGYAVSFVYGDIVGVINILDYNVQNRYLLIYIDGYSRPQGDIIYLDSFKECKLGRILHKKIIDTAPELIPYLKNKSDAYLYSCQSNQRISTICPFCGFEKAHIISNLYKYGFGCPQCSDGKSYAEKFMFNILKQLNMKFNNEITKKDIGFEWIENNYRYDFYFEFHGQKYFVELDGHLHIKNAFGTQEQIHQADVTKDHLANEHDIEVIRIDCCYGKESSRFSYIKNNILNSKLYQLLDFDDVDWQIANKAALNSNINIAAKLWDNGCTVKYIANEIGVSRDTITSYLKIAASLGLCDYNKTLSEQRRAMSIKIGKLNQNQTNYIPQNKLFIKKEGIGA